MQGPGVSCGTLWSMALTERQTKEARTRIVTAYAQAWNSVEGELSCSNRELYAASFSNAIKLEPGQPSEDGHLTGKQIHQVCGNPQGVLLTGGTPTGLFFIPGAVLHETDPHKKTRRRVRVSASCQTKRSSERIF